MTPPNLLPLDHPLVPVAWVANGRGYALHGALEMETFGVNRHCPHLHRTILAALRCAERQRDRLRSGKGLQW